MTNEKAIEILNKVKLGQVTEYQERRGSFNYAINQLKQCEVFDEPVEMELNNGDKVWFKGSVIGKFNNKYLYNTNLGQLAFAPFAKEIKKEYLSFAEYVKDKYNFDSIMTESVPRLWDEYSKYLKQFNNK